MRALARGLDGAALVLAALAVAVLAAGRLRLGAIALERAEDLVVVLALVGGARLAVAPVTLARVLPDVPASINERLVPHLATRAECYIFATGTERAQWVVDLESIVAQAKVMGFQVVAREQGWVLLRRGG